VTLHRRGSTARRSAQEFSGLKQNCKIFSAHWGYTNRDLNFPELHRRMGM